MTDLMPPVPPGAEKKAGFLRKLFSKKMPAEPQPIQDSMVPPPQLAELDVPIPQDKPLDKEISELRKDLGLQSNTKEKTEERDLPIFDKKSMSLDGVALDEDGLPSEFKEPSSSVSDGGIHDLIDDLKPNYSPSNLPPIPKLNANPEEYRSIDFTKDFLKSEPKTKSTWAATEPESISSSKPITKAQVESLDKMRASNGDFDWTSEANHQSPRPKKDETSYAPASIPASNNQDDLIKELEKQVLESPIPEEQPLKTPEVKQSKPVPELPKATEEQDQQFLSQPVQKFADQVRQKIAEQVRKEERQKLLSEVKEEQAKEYQKKDEENKKALDVERQALIKQANDELARARQERQAGQKELDTKKKQLAEDRQALEREKASLSEERMRLEEKEASLAKTRADMKAERMQLEKDKADAQDLLNRLAQMRQEFESLHSKIDMINQRIALNEELEKNLEKREASIEVAQSKFADLEKNIREQGFANYLDTELSAKQITYPETKAKIEDVPQDQDHSEIYQLVDKCRSLIWQNNIKDAKSAYMAARDKYHDLVTMGKDDEHLYMAIRELYDDINLAVMK